MAHVRVRDPLTVLMTDVLPALQIRIHDRGRPIRRRRGTTPEYGGAPPSPELRDDDRPAHGRNEDTDIMGATCPLQLHRFIEAAYSRSKGGSDDDTEDHKLNLHSSHCIDKNG